MIKLLLFIIAVGAYSWYYMDVTSDSIFTSIVLPLGLLLSSFMLLAWLVVVIHQRGINQRGDADTDGRLLASMSDMGSSSDAGGDGGF